jgi:predicted CXXCH cytochrome family protein
MSRVRQRQGADAKRRGVILAAALVLLALSAVSPSSRAGKMRYHPGYQEGECGDCHEGKPGKLGVRHSDVCHSCHERKDAARFLHGPVGAGMCSYCHRPHGSEEKALLAQPVKSLCVSCHDQPSSGEHLRRSAGRKCEECHDPHGSEKKYFLF